MKISELEKELNISRANIRFYEKEGLFTPSRTDNGYRKYTDEDIAVLKKIIIYRKLGISISDIHKIFDNAIDLQDAVAESIVNLQKEIEQLNGSLELCKKMQKNKETNTMLDEKYYWNEINKYESSGSKFIDICKDYAEFEKQIFFDAMKTYFWGFNFEKIEKKHGLLKLSIIFILICICRGISGVLIWKNESFFDGFLAPFIIFSGVSICVLPTFLLKNKYPKIASIWNMIILCIAILLLLAVVGFFIYLVIIKIFKV